MTEPDLMYGFQKRRLSPGNEDTHVELMAEKGWFLLEVELRDEDGTDVYWGLFGRCEDERRGRCGVRTLDCRGTFYSMGK